MKSPVKTLTFEDFSAGIDLREGVVVRDSRKLLNLENCTVTFGRKIKRRVPFDLLTGSLDAQSQGIGYLNGEFIAIAEAGSTIVHNVTGVPVRTIYFDQPEYATTWEVLDVYPQNEKLCVYIKHAYPGGTVTSRNLLHVFDDKHPTWVSDPAVPTNWSKEFPQQPYGTGVKGEFKDYIPSITTVADKLHALRPDGNTGFAAVDRPRVWSDRDANDILDNGVMFYFIAPTAAPPVSFTLPIPYAELTQPQRYAAYVLERLLDNGTWIQFHEVPVITTVGDYTIESAVSRYNPAKTETKLRIQVSAAGQIIRFRALARPALTITTGCALLPEGKVTGGAIDIEGASYNLDNVTITPLAASTFYYVVVVAPNAPISIGNTHAGNAGFMPLNGQQRYWTHIIAVAETDGSGTAFAYALTGTVTTITGDSALDGVGTLFLTEVKPGQSITVNGQSRIVDHIASDVLLHVTEVWTTSVTGFTALDDVSYEYAHEVGDSGNSWFAVQEAEATFTLAGADNAGVLNSSLYDPSGQIPIALGAAQNRLLIQFPESIQLWGVQPNPALNAFLGSEFIGAGVNTDPTSTLVDGFVALPTHSGPMLFAPDGQNKDYLKKVRIGDLVEPILKTVNLTNAVWWPRLRLFVTCEHSNTAGVTMWAFSFLPDDKTAAWSKFTVEGLTRVDKLFVAQDKLYVLSDHQLWRADPAATVFRDSTNDADSPFTSRARWLHNDFGAPSYNKKLLTLDVGQTGTSHISLYTSPFEQTGKTPGPSISGQTMGRQRVPLAAITPAVSLEVTSQDTTGYQLDFVGFTYILAGR